MEYACRGGTTTDQYWGESPESACHYANVDDQSLKGKLPDWRWPISECDDGYAVAAPVGRFTPNRFGLHDMIGNVWEWMENIYVNNAYGKDSRKNLATTFGGSYRVFRGGSWGGDFTRHPGFVRATDRCSCHPSHRNIYLGFRLRRTP